ncbi:C39 family peptidase [Paenibacillus agilis]|uniref:C39 family peptidase n=1 Tax=Paenibacillus agilis TaxID=3020863 RepID=UPI0021BD3970|nr:C39 family peptidase [Paenibacillus agilis]
MVSRLVRQTNRWLLFCIIITLCVFPLQRLVSSKINEGRFSFEMPTDDIVLMLYSNTAIVGPYLVPIDSKTKNAAPYQYSGETLIPARFLADNFDAELTYDNKQGNITLTSEEGSIQYALNKAQAKVEGKSLTLQTKPVVRDGITYVPLRAASEAFGRNLHVEDGVVLLTRTKDAPDSDRMTAWREELSSYIAYEAFGSFTVEASNHSQALFKTWNEAVAYARKNAGRKVTYRGSNQVLWDPAKPPPITARHKKAKAIMQLPELPRGCEVTALAMLLYANDIQVDKMTLAKQIKKEPTPYKKVGNTIYFGNPHDGFVGDMYNINNPGLGVYHEPIAELAEQYAPGRVADITGTTFEHLKYTVGQGTPVWVIHTTLYDAVPEKAWHQWQTPTGPVRITYYEHSLLVTGYDKQYMYVLDPLGRTDRIKIDAFRRGWEQMGSQAIVIMPPTT